MGSIKFISLKNDDLIVILYDLSITGTEIVKMKKERKKLNYNWDLINDQVPAVFLLLIWLFLE